MKLSKKALVLSTAALVTVATGVAVIANQPEEVPVTEVNRPLLDKTYYVDDEKVTETEMIEVTEENPIEQTPVEEPTAPTPAPAPSSGKPSVDYAIAKAKEAGQINSFNSLEGKQAVKQIQDGYNLTQGQRACILGLHSQDLFLFKTVDLYRQTLSYVMNTYSDPCVAFDTFKSTGTY